jgi:general secretion pathway protein C
VPLLLYVAMNELLFNSQIHLTLSRLINSALVLVLAWISASLIWGFADSWLSVEDSIPTNLKYRLIDSSRDPEKKSNPEQIAAKIAKNHIFGFQKVTAKKIVKKKKIAPKTRLDLKLIGAFENGALGRAIIEHKKKQNSYGVGDKIVAVNAKVKEVYFAYVVIERNGREEIIELEKDKLDQKFVLKEKSEQAVGGELAIAEIAANFKAFRKQAIASPEEAFKKMRFIPEKGKNGLKGYRIVAGSKDRGFLARFGFRNGDLVTTVNGIEINSVDQGLQVLYELESTSEITVDYLRAGQLMTLSASLGE